jgi:uncharacterized repeat protein (TIGR02543 family)
MKVQENEYEIIRDSGIETVVATTVIEALGNEDREGDPVKQVTRIKTGIFAIVQDAPVIFEVAIDPPNAEAAGCVALPSAYTVPFGAIVLFEAIPGTGYTFSGWYQDQQELSTDLQAELTMDTPVNGRMLITAKFALV